MVCKKGVRYYHGTTCSKAKIIRSNGLKTTEAPVHIETYESDRRHPKPAVFVTNDFHTAVEYGYDASKDCDPDQLDQCSPEFDNICVIQINSLPKGARLSHDKYGDCMVDRAIPPEHLTILDNNEVANRLGKMSVKEYYVGYVNQYN